MIIIGLWILTMVLCAMIPPLGVPVALGVLFYAIVKDGGL